MKSKNGVVEGRVPAIGTETLSLHAHAAAELQGLRRASHEIGRVLIRFSSQLASTLKETQGGAMKGEAVEKLAALNKTGKRDWLFALLFSALTDGRRLTRAERAEIRELLLCFKREREEGTVIQLPVRRQEDRVRSVR